MIKKLIGETARKIYLILLAFFLTIAAFNAEFLAPYSGNTQEEWDRFFYRCLALFFIVVPIAFWYCNRKNKPITTVTIFWAICATNNLLDEFIYNPYQRQFNEYVIFGTAFTWLVVMCIIMLRNRK